MNKKGTTSEATPKKDIIIGSGKGIDIIINLKKNKTMLKGTSDTLTTSSKACQK